MASLYDTCCPNCEKEFIFSKWDLDYQEVGEVTCPKCGCTFNERSKFIVEESKFILSDKCIKSLNHFLLESADISEEEREEILERLF